MASGKSSDPQTFNRYVYVLNRPLNLVDPDGRSPSTHIDEDGKIIAVILDGDTGVYQHKNNADGKAPTEYMIKKRQGSTSSYAGGGTKIGETQYVDEFISPETGRTYTNYTIQVGKQFDTAIEKLHDEAKGMDLKEIAKNSGSGGKFDFKKEYANVGAILNGKYVTSRSAGNYLAGYNAASGTYLGVGISFDTFQKMAGGMQFLGRNLTKTELTRIAVTGYSYDVGPTYGELDYQRRMSVEGYYHIP